MRTGAVLAAFAAFAAFGCDAPRTSEGLELPASAVTEHAASALVAEPRHDFGRAVQGDTLRHAFVTRNATSRALAVEEPRDVLGCSGKPVPRVLGSGATGRLEVACRASIHGPLRVSLPLRAGGSAAGELKLTAEIEPLLTFDRALLEVNVAFGATGLAEARLRGARAAAARLAALTPVPEWMTTTVLPAADGANQGVALHARGAAAGTHAGSLRFATGLAEPSEIELGYLVKVPSTLAVSPTNPVLDLGASDRGRTVVRVTSQTPGFRVKRVEVLEGPFGARVRKDGTAYAVEVFIAAAELSRNLRGANGRLLIVSNDRAEPRKEIPLFALGSATAASDGGAR